MADEEFDEEEVWSLVKESGKGKGKGHSFLTTTPSSSSSPPSRRLPSVSRAIPRTVANVEAHGIAHRQSAPVNIPDWSKIHSSNASVEENTTKNNEDDEVDGDDDDDDEKVPPHEWIAKKLARSQISSFSVCEGAGRTLKGRDQRKVRNAVLTKTGFLE